jgi:hypothetical protein
MYIERVVLTNIKGFRDADLNFAPAGERHAGWAVVTGDNGAGKTALLRAIALALLGPDQYRAALPDIRGWITHGEQLGTVSIELRPGPNDTTQKGGFPYKSTFWAEIEFVRESEATLLGTADVFRKKKKGATNGPWAETTQGWFAVGYGPFRRLYGSSPDASRMMAIPGRPPRFGTLFKEDATLGESEEWIRNLHFKALEHGQAPEARILDQLLMLLRDDFLRHGMEVEGVTSEGLILRDTAGQRLGLEEMSEGYRSAIAMLVDIYRHMSSVYGDGIVATGTDGPYVDRPGVVMIDEVDAHLHPQWQREIGFWLARHFPEVQFIVTTHSPLVCAAATDRRIYHLPAAGDGVPFQLSPSDADRVIAGKPDEILLTPAFGLTHTRSPRAVEAQRRHSLLVSKQLTLGALSEDERQELEQLRLFVDESNGDGSDAEGVPPLASARSDD